MQTLNIKLLRDFRRLWAQALAIALVVAGGVATMVLGVGAHHSLEKTRDAYYAQYGFADLFATVRRAPMELLPRLAELPGVSVVETRIAQLALLDIPNFREPATGHFISLPEKRAQALNRLYLRSGRWPDPQSDHEVVVSEGFASAHGFAAGARFAAVMNGRKRELVIVGTALSPEFIFAVGPGDIMPDNRRFAVVWMPERALAAAYNLKGAFSALSVKLLPHVDPATVLPHIDALLKRYGGRAAYARKDQTSHAWLDHELTMLENMSRTLPPIFLMVTAFLVNLTLGRLVALEREQIGLLKALGYSNRSVAWHYLQFVLAIACCGILIGSAAGTLWGSQVTRLFGDFFRFPFLLFSKELAPYLLGAGLSLAAALVGALRAIGEVVRLAPATAMQPPAPPRYRHLWGGKNPLGRLLTQPVVMMTRNIVRYPLRSAFTVLGIAMAAGILVVSLFVRDTMENLVDVTFFLADRQSATLILGERRSASVVYETAHLPGVLATQAVREVPVRIRRGNIERRVVLSGRPGRAQLSRVIDERLHPLVLPTEGLAISGYLARTLGVAPGDLVELDLLEGKDRTTTVPVAATVEDYFGLRAMMDADAMARLMREAPAVNSVHVAVDSNRFTAFYSAVKATPNLSGVALQHASLANFREAVAVLVTTMAGIYTALAVVIAFGVVYNNARISLSERARDLASMRVLGFTRGEVLRILLLELAVLTVLAQPLGWSIGYGLAWIMKARLAGEVMRVRLVVAPMTYALASLVILGAAALSALVVRRRVYGLDLVAVLKTRD
jgi:putative ABC transport system permease protein